MQQYFHLTGVLGRWLYAARRLALLRYDFSVFCCKMFMAQGYGPPPLVCCVATTFLAKVPALGYYLSCYILSLLTALHLDCKSKL